MIRRYRQWLLRRRAARYNQITFPGTTIHLNADNSSTVAYQIGKVDLRRRADDE